MYSSKQKLTRICARSTNTAEVTEINEFYIQNSIEMSKLDFCYEIHICNASTVIR